MYLYEVGPKNGRIIQDACYVYNTLQDTFIRLHAFVGFVTTSYQLHAWSWII